VRHLLTHTSGLGTGVVQGHTLFFGWPLPRSEPRYTEAMIAAGYVVSSAHDMGRFLRMYLNGGRASEGSLLSQWAVDETFALGRGAESQRPLAWGRQRLHGHFAYGHAGMTPGCSARLMVVPGLDYGIAVLAARNDGPFLPAYRELMEGLVARLAGAPDVETRAPARRWLWLRLCLLGLLAWSLISFGRLVTRWWRRGRPRVIHALFDVLSRLVGRIALTIGGLLFVLWGLAKMPLAALLEFYPDLALLLLVDLALVGPEAWLKATVRSHDRRCREDRKPDPEGRDGSTRTPAA
jgi:hypothetical protein